MGLTQTEIYFQQNVELTSTLFTQYSLVHHHPRILKILNFDPFLKSHFVAVILYPTEVKNYYNNIDTGSTTTL